MEETTSVPGVGYKDRSTGLIIFGILQIIVGAVCALFIPMMIAGQAMSAKMTGGETNYRMIIPGVLLYGALAVIFFALGIGSCRARRWARALSLILGWSWLVTGIVTIMFISVFMFRTFTKVFANMPPSAMWVAVTIMSVIFGIIFIILPSALVLFYRSQHVKATCEGKDPVIRWTDTAPLPVIALSLWMAFGAFSMLSMPVAYNGVMPLFGKLITGMPGTILMLLFGALWGYCAWAIYKRNPVGWWIVFVCILVFMTSAIVTFNNIDLPELYTAMGYPAAQVEQLKQADVLSGKVFSVWMVILMAALIGFLVAVKKHFRKNEPAPLQAGL